MGLDWRGTDFGMNQNKSDWFGMNFNPKLLPVLIERSSYGS